MGGKMGELLICDPVAASAIDAIRATGVKVDVRDDITPEELAEVIGTYEGMVVRSRTKDHWDCGRRYQPRGCGNR